MRAVSMKAITVVGLALLAACSPAAEETERLEVRAVAQGVPQVCLDALDEADEIVEFGLEQSLLLGEQNEIIFDMSIIASDAVLAAVIGDSAGIDEQTAKLDGIITRIENIGTRAELIADRLEENRYRELADACRDEAR